MNKGLMIVCDGGNGAGKTTIIKSIERHLQDLGHDVVVTREPGGTNIGERIREILLSPEATEMCDTTELLLFGAARAQHVREKILPALAAGKMVVSDRFDAATVSFQHYARGLDLDIIDQVNRLALGDFRPDLNIILDIDPAAGLERVMQRGAALDRMEGEKLAFLQKARDGYLRQAHAEPARFRVIDASQPLERVVADTLEIVDQLLAA